MRRLTLVALAVAAAVTALVAAQAVAQTCLVEGRITFNGGAAANEPLRCLHTGGETAVTTDANGDYHCAVEAGAVALEMRRQTSPVCPVQCDGDCAEPIVCNASVSTCANPSAAFAMLLPPVVWLPRRWRAARRPA